MRVRYEEVKKSKPTQAAQVGTPAWLPQDQKDRKKRRRIEDN